MLKTSKNGINNGRLNLKKKPKLQLELIFKLMNLEMFIDNKKDAVSSK